MVESCIGNGKTEEVVAWREGGEFEGGWREGTKGVQGGLWREKVAKVKETNSQYTYTMGRTGARKGERRKVRGMRVARSVVENII